MISAIEAEHPLIANRIVAIWGEPECAAYLRRLLIQDRDGRSGFAIHIWAALAGLQELHEMLYPQKNNDVWENAP